MMGIFLSTSKFVRGIIPESSINFRTLHLFIRIHHFDNFKII